MENTLLSRNPKKSGSEYFNYKGYFSLVLLALVDADYKFLWVNMGASGSSSDAQIFNRCKLKRSGGPDLHYFLLRDDAFTLKPWLVKPYSRRQLTRENSQLQDIQGEKGGRDTCQAIQDAVDHHGAEAKSCERHCVNVCGTT